jgi:hypothetical protein
MSARMFLLAALSAAVPAVPAVAAVPLSASQMDSLTAGELLGVTAVAAALGISVDGPALAITRTRTFARPHVAFGYAFAISYGNVVSETSASVTAVGDMTHTQSHTVATPSGLSISIATGVAH